MKINIATLFSVATACALFGATSVQAAPINYGDFEDYAGGGVIEYQEVEEDTGTDTAPLFGAPDITVNELDFDPSAFVSTADGGALDITDGQLNFDFELLPGAGLTSLVFEEHGDFTFIGASTATTKVGYGLTVFVEITEVDGAWVAPFTVTGTTSGSADLATSPGLNQIWNLSLPVDFAADLVANGHAGFSEGVTAGKVALNNTLTSISEVGTLAFIAKKDFDIIPGGDLDPDNNIPEPTALVLALIGAAALTARRNG